MVNLEKQNIKAVPKLIISGLSEENINHFENFFKVDKEKADELSREVREAQIDEHRKSTCIFCDDHDCLKNDEAILSCMRDWE